MRSWSIVGLAALGATLCANAPGEVSRVDRARFNYEALLNGRKQLRQFSQQELADVLEFDRRLLHQDDRSLSQRCIDDEVKRAGGHPSALAQQVIDMKCRNLGEPLN